jgi:ubiquinone/menaquinone biosynthesis C-methylase UbiE
MQAPGGAVAIEGERGGRAQSYSHLAADYDRTRFMTPGGRYLYNTDRRLIRRFLAEASPRRVLDAPTGTGRVLEYVDGLDLDVVGVDYTTEMLDHARKVAGPSVGLLRGNAARLPFDDGAFDAVISLRFFHLFRPEERASFANEFQRVVRPGGHVIVSFTNGWYGGGLGWAARAAGKKTVYFEHAGEVTRLFPRCRIRRRAGNVLPMQWRLRHVSGVRHLVEACTRRFPLNRVCWERFYLLQRV